MTARPVGGQYSSGSRNVVTLRSASVIIQRVFAKPLARDVGVSGVGGQDAKLRRHCFIVRPRVLAADIAPITARVSGKATHQMVMRAGFQCSGRGDYFPKGKRVGYGMRCPVIMRPL